MKLLNVWIAIIVASFWCGGLCSAGDRDQAFQQCVGLCTHTGCGKAHMSDAWQSELRCSTVCNSPAQPGYFLKVFRWDCEADCSYICMQLVEELRTSTKGAGGKTVKALKPRKYYGKWPFLRFMGMQEPASVAFSLANLAVHAACLPIIVSDARRLARGQRDEPWQALLVDRVALWMVFCLVNINSWVWSAVFHARDTPRTQTLDYVSADANVAMALVASVLRTVGDTWPRHYKLLFSGCIFGLYMRHVYFLTQVKFDFGYNMTVCITCGVITALLWLGWGLLSRHPSRGKVLVFVVLAHCAVALEVKDFPPIVGLYDAHSLWHIVTVPLSILWYSFVFDDLENPSVLASGDKAGLGKLGKSSFRRDINKGGNAKVEKQGTQRHWMWFDKQPKTREKV